MKAFLLVIAMPKPPALTLDEANALLVSASANLRKSFGKASATEVRDIQRALKAGANPDLPIAGKSQDVPNSTVFYECLIAVALPKPVLQAFLKAKPDPTFPGYARMAAHLIQADTYDRVEGLVRLGVDLTTPVKSDAAWTTGHQLMTLMFPSQRHVPHDSQALQQILTALLEHPQAEHIRQAHTEQGQTVFHALWAQRMIPEAYKREWATRLLEAGFTTTPAQGESIWFSCPIPDVLLAQGWDVNGPTPEGFSPLASALMNGRWANAQTLLDAGADPNGPSGPKPLVHYLIESLTTAGTNMQRVPTVQAMQDLLHALVLKGASLEQTDTNGVSGWQKVSAITTQPHLRASLEQALLNQSLAAADTPSSRRLRL